MQNIALIGSSGHAGVLANIFSEQREHIVVGIIDPFLQIGEIRHGYSVIGSYNDIHLLIDKYAINGIVIAIGDNYTRFRISTEIATTIPSIAFVTARHPSAIIPRTVKIGVGSVIMAGVVINPGASVGKHCILNTNSSLDHNSSMKDYSSIAPNVAIAGNVVIGECSAIGIGASVSNNINIDSNCVIGAGATVLSDIAAYSLAYGTPAKVVRTRNIDEKYM